VTDDEFVVLSPQESARLWPRKPPRYDARLQDERLEARLRSLEYRVLQLERLGKRQCPITDSRPDP
jgi:hypothetical protein